MKDVVQIVFVSKSRLLLAFRQNTGVFDQYWGFPSGRIEDGEFPLSAAKREAMEEVSVETRDLKFIAKLADPERPISHYFYICLNWSGEIKNAEVKLCREIRWFDIEELPDNCTPITYSILKQLKEVVYNS